MVCQLHLLLLIRSVILSLQMIGLLLQLVHLVDVLVQVINGVRHILGRQLVQRSAVVHGASVRLPIQLQNRAAEGGLAAAGFAHQAKGLALVDIQGDAVVGLVEQAVSSHGEVLLQVGDLQQNLFILILLHACDPPFSGRSSGSAGSRRHGSWWAPPPGSARWRTCSGERTCSPSAAPAGGAPRRG